MKTEKIRLCCQECGERASNKGQRQISTWSIDKCDVCKKEKAVTEVRDFYYPDFK